MIKKTDILYLIRHVLDGLQRTAKKSGWNSPKAQMLVLATGMVESNYFFLRQRSSKNKIGKARGFWQFEPWVAQSVINDYIEYRPTIYRDVEKICMVDLSKLDDPSELDTMRYLLQGNLLLGIALCRIKYRPIPAAIPNTIDGQARYWLKYYNAGGKGTIKKFIQGAELLD